MTHEPDEGAADRRSDVVKKPRRFRMRIRDWLVAVALVALLAAGVAQLIRARRLRLERELARAIRLQEEAVRAREALLKEVEKEVEAKEQMLQRNQAVHEKKVEEAKKLSEALKEKLRQREATSKGRDGVLPAPDRKGQPDGRTVL